MDEIASAAGMAVELSPFAGYADPVVGDVISGWSLNVSSPGMPVALGVWIDGLCVDHIECGLPREDVAQYGVTDSCGGFSFSLPDRFRDGIPHVLELRFPDGSHVNFQQAGGATAGFWHFCLSDDIVIEGCVDGVVAGGIRGWIVRTNNRTGKVEGRVDVAVYCNGSQVCLLKADKFRADVAAAKGCEPNVGFDFQPRPEHRNGREFRFSFFAMPQNAELHNSPFGTSFPTADHVGRLHKLHHRAQVLCKEMWALEREIMGMVPSGTHTVADYDNWAKAYYREQKRRVAEDRGTSAPNGPLVSVIVPTFRPVLAEFIAAVESVRAQTYANWELLIVDDCSGSAELDACLTSFAAEDPRIRVFRHETNMHISGGTNTAIENARGEWIALFDHDDLLVDVALEVMVRAAERSGAEFLYSDEDKIDETGTFSEPHFKPDYNHRLLLGMNYICHLALIRKDLLDRVGPLDRKCDGAQDHDLFLRITECLPEEAIHHVPELLYHWRKTVNSTASSGGAKPYAVRAGVRAVSQHLRRMGFHRAEVSPINGVTMYSVDWRFTAEPSVTIVIPFKDQSDVTRRCLEALLTQTEYSNYKVVLVDNWSQKPETRAFCAEAANSPRVTVMRIEERFNYSRLNNLAVAAHPAEYIVFLNNDVFLAQRNWLRVLLSECLADPKVGIVGAKLIYPNQTVQHAGVIMGVGGIAEHAFKGVSFADPGYVGRALVAQEFSAVTAACMLIRSDVFHEVGRFDEIDLSVAFNDVDLCLKTRKSGYKVVWTPELVAEHHESLSRGEDVEISNHVRFFGENQVMSQRWAHEIANDPFYSPHFSRTDGIFRDLADPARLQLKGGDHV